MEAFRIPLVEPSDEVKQAMGQATLRVVISELEQDSEAAYESASRIYEAHAETDVDEDHIIRGDN